MQRADPVSTKEQALDAQRQLYDSPISGAAHERCVPVTRRSLLSREAGSLISHTKILRLLLADAGRTVPPEVNAALLTFEGWAVSLIAAEINQPIWSRQSALRPFDSARKNGVDDAVNDAACGCVSHLRAEIDGGHLVPGDAATSCYATR